MLGTDPPVTSKGVGLHCGVAQDIARPPGPPPRSGGVLDTLKYYYNFFADPIGFVSGRFTRYGDVYYVDTKDGGLYVIRHPDHMRQVLVTDAASYRKTHAALRRISEVLGEGLVNSDGAVWKRHRRMIQPAFRKERLRHYATMMVQEAIAEVERWSVQAPLDLGAAMTQLTLRVVSRSLFSHDVARDIDDVGAAVSAFQGSISRPDFFPRWLPTPQRQQMRRSVGNLDHMMYELVRQRRARLADGSGSHDLLQMLLEVKDEQGDGAGLSDQEIRDQLVTFFLAGHETTSHALTWTWYLLSQNPAEEARLHAELDAVLGDRPPTFDDLEALPYAGRVIKEAMRMYPPVYMIARKAHRDTHIGDHAVPAGSEIAAWVYMTHRDHRWYSEPDVFRPDRFTPEREAALPKQAYLPFGSGPRTCIGKIFATVEATLLLATMAQRFSLRTQPGHRVEVQPRVTLLPRYGMPMLVHRRPARL